jgi:hypothetical protein
MMEIQKDIIDGAQKCQLIWFAQINRMDEIRRPRKVLEWVPQEKHYKRPAETELKRRYKESNGSKGSH